MSEKQSTHSTEGSLERPPLANHDSSILDLAFAMDCTGSMGSYIRNAQQSIRHIVETIVAAEKSDIHLALVEYRDHPPQDSSFVTRVHDFTPSVSRMKKDLDACSASGGGDCPEAVADALHQISKLSWRKEATKICVFIADAPPHGLGCSGDGFPNGCPDNLDPMEITQTLAQMGVTLYLVGCEPSIRKYKDFFMALAHTTGGQYVPLSNANLLSQVIIGGAQEEISLDRLIESAEAEVEEEVMAAGGYAGVSEDFLSHRVMEKMNARKCSMNIKQVQMGAKAIPEASNKAKKISALKNMADVRAEYATDMSLSDDVGDSLYMAAPRSMSMAKTSSKKKSRGGKFGFFSKKSSSGISTEETRNSLASSPAPAGGIGFAEGADEVVRMEDAGGYTVAEKDELDLQQARRMAKKIKNKYS